MLLLLITLCVIPLVALSFFFKGIKQFVLNYLELKKIPGPPISNIIFGSIPTLHTSRENIFQKLRQWARIYYPIYNISFLHKVITFLHTPEDCEVKSEMSRFRVLIFFGVVDHVQPQAQHQEQDLQRAAPLARNWALDQYR